ncbi:phosphate/phosphite/phosphonate ABC transporter substrate-binding protein [bacterium]|nr:MAG: phosphate/phosphite/phosphonate ABC transporter substrate-binding protein [bacterium]
MIRLLILSALVVTGCTFKKAELGTAENPVKLFFVPAVDAQVIDANAKLMKAWMETNTPYKFQVFTPQNYIAVVEAFGSGRADVAGLNTFGYLLANQKYGAVVKMVVVRYGKTTYQSAIIAKKGRFKDIKELAGKKIAYVDPASLSGYILPQKFLADQGVKPADSIFAMTHDNVVSMVYQGRVDAGATFYSPPDPKGEIRDARHWVKTQYPDVEQRVEILRLTNEIPNDPIVFRKEVPDEMKTKIIEAFLKMTKDEKGRAALDSVYGATDLQAASEKDFAGVKAMVETLNGGQPLEKFLKK